MTKRIAFATYEGFPNLTDDDRLAADELAERSIQVDPVLWSDPLVDWSHYSSVIVRSCWDYHQKPDEFRSWLEKLETENAVLWNPVDILCWNMDKTYLIDLQEQGVPVLESVWLSADEPTNLRDLMRQKDWGQAVVKPVISAAAANTQVVALDRANDRQHHFESLLKKGGVIVQNFAEEILSDGEWSLIFFNKQFSHAVLKHPQNGDFRVQRDFGGTAHPIDGPRHLIDQAQNALERINNELLYARVDGIERNGKLFLMELELIEPHLFFELDSQAAKRFASAFIELSSKSAIR
jgi:hypothetical protein